MFASLHHHGQMSRIHVDDWLSKLQTMRLKGVIFDCDGTLVDSATAHCRAMQAGARDQGYDMPADWYLARTGFDRQALFEAFRQTSAPALDISRAVAVSIASFANHLDCIHPIPETVALFRALQAAGLRVAIATNSEREIALHSLGTTGLLTSQIPLVSISDGVAAKPAPAMFERAATLLGLANSDIAVFEDSDQGVQAAKAAQMPVFRVE